MTTPAEIVDKANAFVGQLYKQVPVLDTGARGSTVTFAQRGLGDVLPTWENEAYLVFDEFGRDKFDVVVGVADLRKRFKMLARECLTNPNRSDIVV